MIWTLDALPADKQREAGGKARTLAWMRQAGYPVPPGLVISAAAFEDGRLRDEAWGQIQTAVNEMRREKPDIAFAVRSSALEEDSQSASFAGEFESLLDVRSDEEIRRAVAAVFASQFSERVAVYRAAMSGPAAGSQQSSLAVLVQELVPAIFAGVLFTADPVSSSENSMSGSYVRGLGEQLVAGAVDGQAFTLDRISGRYDGPAELRPYAKQLFKYGDSLARELQGPQDIEWAVDGAGVHLLQSRPITTMQAYDPATGIWNDSRRGDYLWSNSNFGEAFPDVMTPLTWSLVQIYGEETFDNPLPGDHPFMGNIGGRFYINLSLFKSFFEKVGFGRERLDYESEEFFGKLPQGIDIPQVPFSRLAVLRHFGPFAARAIFRHSGNLRRLEQFTANLPWRTAVLQEMIDTAASPAELAEMWRLDIEPLLRKSYQMLQAGTSAYENVYRPLRRGLLKQVDAEDAYLLLSDVSVPGERLDSLGPLFGLWQVAHGEMAREEYVRAYGHRGPHEMELSWPRPAENPDWIDEQLAALAETDVPAMLAAREQQQQEAWQRFQEQYPRDAAKVGQKIKKAAAAARGREAIRSQVTRLYALVRSFALKAGELTGLGEDVFFLWLEELLDVLEGDSSAAAHIPKRREAHETLSSLPPYPALINGRFDPQTWASDPQRRTDIYDAHTDTQPGADRQEDLISGYPGSAGIAEGTVRVLHSSEEGHLLQAGEVLVATTTNVGWTPLFPRAAAVVTNVGAPLSHAAIVARELGIPAVVGTGDGTMRLKTGDRVRVNGAQGTVEKLGVEN